MSLYPHPLPPTIHNSLYLQYLHPAGIKKPHELMKMSEVIKRGDTDPGRVSEGQEVHMGPRPACTAITLLPYSVPMVPRLHGTQIWLDWPAGHGQGGGLVKLAPRGGGGRGRMEGGRLSSGLTCGPGAPPWIPPLAARSRCVVQTPPAWGGEQENNSMEGREV